MCVCVLFRYVGVGIHSILVKGRRPSDISTCLSTLFEAGSLCARLTVTWLEMILLLLPSSSRGMLGIQTLLHSYHKSFKLFCV